MADGIKANNRFFRESYSPQINVAVLDTGIFRHRDFDNRIVAFKDFVNGKNIVYDDSGHGTHVSGIIAAYVNPEMALNSQKGFKGICKKITILILVSLAHFIDLATSQNFIHIVVTWFFLGNEGLSIVENAAKIGVPIPAKLKKSLEQLSNEKYKRGNRK